MSICYITCSFGTSHNMVSYINNENQNYFYFTNNKDLKQSIVDGNWIYVYVDMPLSIDILQSSLQSKYIKFLQFMDKYPHVLSFEKIVYIDNKYIIPLFFENNVKELIDQNQMFDVIVKKHPNMKHVCIWDEVNAAMGQIRYRKNMPLTLKYIHQMIQEKKISDNIVICATGLIIYNNYQGIKPMIQNIYDKCMEHQQPECQIYWAIFCQEYQDRIKVIPFNNLLSYEYHRG